MRTRVRLVVLGLLVLVATSAAWTAVELRQARSELVEARGLLEGARDTEEPRGALPDLRRALDLLDDAEARLGRPGPQLIAGLPFAGRSVDAAASTAAAAAATVRGGVAVLEQVPERLLVEGRLDLVAVGQLEAALRKAEADARGPVRRLQQAQLTGVPSSVARSVRDAQDRLAGVPEALLRSAEALAAIRGVLGDERERRLLIVLQNNAELRATGGLVSVFAEATARDGELRFTAFREVGPVADPPETARPVEAPEDFQRLYAPFKAATTLWKNVNMSADVPTSSEVVSRVAAATLPAAPDVVVWVDVPAVASLLRATGPVRLPDGTALTAGNAVRRLLSDAYAEAAPVTGGQEERQDELRAAADAVIRQLLDERNSTSATRLAQELGGAVAGRHLAVWSADEAEQERLVTGRMAGEVRAGNGDLSSLTVHNLGSAGSGNKLDYYARRQVTVRVEVAADQALVEQELAIRNTAPSRGLPEYVAGNQQPGTANSLVTIAVPRQAEIESLRRDEQRLRVDVAPFLDHSLLQDVVSIPPGETVTWRVRYRLPLVNGRYTSRLLPQPLAVDAGLLLDVRPADGQRLMDGALSYSGPYDKAMRVDVELRRPSTWDRFSDSLRRFWNEPVRLP